MYFQYKVTLMYVVRVSTFYYTLLQYSNQSTSVFLIHLSITTVLHVPVFYVDHLQGELIIICTEPFVFYSSP